MDLELSSIHVHRPVGVQLIHAFCLLWPFIAAALMRSRVRSAAPVAGLLVPLALGTAAVWLGIIETARGMAVSGAGVASTAAGFADSLTSMYLPAFSAAAVAVFALVRRHGAFVDRASMAILAVTAANIAAAVIAARNILGVPISLVVIGPVAGLAAALVALWWFVRHARGEREGRAIPFGVPIFVAIVVIAGVAVWQQVQHYRGIAIMGYQPPSSP